MISVSILADGEYLTAGSGDGKAYAFDKADDGDDDGFLPVPSLAAAVAAVAVIALRRRPE